MTADRRTLLKYGLASFAALQAAASSDRRALAAPADAPITIDPNPGYQRIACEEAWTTKELVAAQLEWTESPAAREQPYIANMTRGFAGNARFQEPLQDLGAGRIAAMDRCIPEGTKLERKISEYMRDNLYITTSGMAWAPAIQFCQDVLGVDHVLYAMDYPYQMDDFEVVATDTVPIPYEDKKKLFQTNAERLFNL